MRNLKLAPGNDKGLPYRHLKKEKVSKSQDIVELPNGSFEG